MNSTITRVIFGFLLVLAGFGVALASGSLGTTGGAVPSYAVLFDSKPDLSATSWIVFDYKMGRVLFEQNADTPLPIASVTKLVTATVFAGENDMDALTTVTWADTTAEGGAGKLHTGDVYTNRELLFPLLLESSNDAAATLSRVDSELLSGMNVFAQSLKLTNTSFTDTSGLSAGNVSTARELMLVSHYILSNTPRVFDITRLTEYYGEDNGWLNNNPFVHDESYRGGKHGFTNEAGHTAVAFFDENLKGGTRRTIGYVLLQSDNLTSDMDVLREYVIQHTSYR